MPAALAQLHHNLLPHCLTPQVIPSVMVQCNLQLPFTQTVSSQICTHAVAGGSGGGSALSKLPSTKASNKYDDFDLPERTNGSTKADIGGGFAGQSACLPVYAPC